VHLLAAISNLSARDSHSVRSLQPFRTCWAASPPGPKEELSMAEIRVQKKKGIPVWVILLALILIALIVWAIASLRDRGGEKVVNQGAALMAPAGGLDVRPALAHCA
jgi:hypothetical protein